MMVKPLPVFVRCFFLPQLLFIAQKKTAVSSPQEKDALSSGHFNLLYPMSDFMGRRYIYISIDQSTTKINYALVN